MKRFAGLVATLTLAVGMLFTFAAEANATPPGNCTSGYVCVWKDIGFSSNGSSQFSVRAYYYIPKLGSYSWPGGGNAGDSASSEYNSGTGGEAAYFFNDSGCSGTWFSQSAGNGWSNIGSFNDKLSSMAFASQLQFC